MSESDCEKTREEREEERDEEGELAKVWNLRPRKQKNKDQSGKEIGGTALPGRVAAKDVKKGKVEKFSISLTKMEIEQDFLTMTGSKPSSRPKKRSKTIQKQLDDTYPGMWLESITPDSYEGRMVEELNLQTSKDH